MKSKIILFSLLTLLFWGILSCNDDLKKNHTIPYTPVDTRINLSYADFQDLNFIGRPVYLTYSVPTAKPLGYRGNGIIVIKTGESEYKCYDATCPNCVEADTHIEITKGEQVAECPTCQTRFFLPYGVPLDPEDEQTEPVTVAPLQAYPVSIAGNILIIRY